MYVAGSQPGLLYQAPRPLQSRLLAKAVGPCNGAFHLIQRKQNNFGDKAMASSISTLIFSGRPIASTSLV